MKAVWVSTALLYLAAAVQAGPGEAVDVRVFNRVSGELLAERSVGLEQRLSLDFAANEQRYLGFRRVLLRGNEVLEISLANGAETWQPQGYTSWDGPALNRYGAIEIETVPVGWAERFCQDFDAIVLPAERDPSLSLKANGELHLSRPGWSGTAQVDLLIPGQAQDEPQWQARIDADQQLFVHQGRSATWQSVGSVRDDYFMIRELSIADGRIEINRIEINYIPGSYAGRFCDRYRERGEAYAQMIADYALGRR